MSLPDLAERIGLQMRSVFSNMCDVARDLYPTAVFTLATIEMYAESLERQSRLTPAVQEAVDKAVAIQSRTVAVAYIAGGLTGVDEKTKERYGQVSQSLAGYGKIGERDVFFGYVPHLHGTDPVKHPSVTPQEVRDIDYLWAGVVADYHINFLHPMAHGNAIEEGWGEQVMVPTIYMNPEGNKLSRLTVGMNNVISTVQYETTEEALGGLKLVTDEYATWLRTFPERDLREFYYMSARVLRTPTLVVAGLDPKQWSPDFGVDQFMVYVNDPENPNYGRVGNLDWYRPDEYGVLSVSFPDGTTTEFVDKQGGYSYWLK